LPALERRLKRLFLISNLQCLFFKITSLAFFPLNNDVPVNLLFEKKSFIQNIKDVFKNNFENLLKNFLQKIEKLHCKKNDS